MVGAEEGTSFWNEGKVIYSVLIRQWVEETAAQLPAIHGSANFLIGPPGVAPVLRNVNILFTTQQ